jgi:transposase
MAFEDQGEYPVQWKAIESIAAKLSVNHETLRIWARRAGTDAGQHPGPTNDERQRMKALEKENAELCRANEILGAASALLLRRPRSVLEAGRWLGHRPPERGQPGERRPDHGGTFPNDVAGDDLSLRPRIARRIQLAVATPR